MSFAFNRSSDNITGPGMPTSYGAAQGSLSYLERQAHLARQAQSNPNLARSRVLISQDNNIKQVIEYLSKKGYNKTEAMLRTESAAHDADGRPIVTRAEDGGGKQWLKAMDLLKTWTDSVLDIFKPELSRLVWPVFVYSYLEMIKLFFVDDASELMERWKPEFEVWHRDDIRKLQAITLPEHLADSEIARIYHSNKYRLTLSSSAYIQMIVFLEGKETEGGSVIFRILNASLNIVTAERAADDRISLARMMDRYRTADEFPAEDEGIPGHNPGSANMDATPGSAVLTRLKLGPLPMEPDLLQDVMAELEDEDAKHPSGEGKSSFVQELDRRIKREESDDTPSRTDVPMPPSKVRDVRMEVRKIKENRDRFKIDASAGSTPPGVSVCMFTFHNSYNSINCIKISDDNNIMAVGTSESYIRVWSVDGTPMPSLRKNDQPQASRRLIGHSGPVYNLSFQPAIADPDRTEDPLCPGSTNPKMLLSCSADKSVRLWHLGLWQCLVVYKGHLGPVWDVAWGPFGHYFMTGSHDKTARLWSTEHIAPVRYFAGHDQDVDKVAFHPNNAYCFTASCDKTVRMWAVMNGYCVRMFTGHTGNITSMECSPNGKLLATADDAGAILIWDLAPGRLLKRMRGHDKGGIWAVSWCAESTVLVSGGADGTVRIWDVTKRTDAAGQGKVIGDGGSGSKIELGGGAGAGASQAQAGGSSSKKKAKAKVVSADQISAFPTKKSPVFTAKFTRMNLAMAAGCYLP